MPYKVMMSGGKHAVFKVDEDGKPVGKPIGTHPDAASARRQMQALYANEKKPKKEAEPFIYTATSDGAANVTITQSGDAEATKETEAENKDYYGTPVEVVLVESACGPLTFADLMAEEAVREATYEMYNLTDQFSRLSRNIMNSDTEDKVAALVALAKEYEKLVSDKAKLETEKTIAKQIAGDNQPKKTTKSISLNSDQTPETTDAPGGDSEQVKTTTDTQSLFIWKEGDVYRWLAAYSNNRRDSDNPPEIISTRSHKEFDEVLSRGEWPMPELWPWHVPFPVGVADYHAFDESTGFPVAAGHFYKGMEWAAEGMMKAGWDGTSHGMSKDWIARDENDPTIIVRHRTKEISPLPTWAAANKLAFTIISKETTMADEKGLPVHKRDEFIKAFGEERVTQIEAALADKAKEADDAGIEKKEQAGVPEQKEVEKPLTQADLVKALEFVSDGIKEVIGNLDTRLKAIEDSQVEEKDRFDIGIIAKLQAASIIGKEAARIDGRSSLAKDAPKEAAPLSPTEQAVGMRLSLIDQFIGANEAWYNGGGK